MNIKNLFFLILFSVLFSCNTQKIGQGKNNGGSLHGVANANPTYGKFDAAGLKQIRDSIAAALHTKIPDNKSILINYYQYSDNKCSLNGVSDASADRMMYGGLRISYRVSREANAVDFFVYNEDVLNKDRILRTNSFIKDNGFFSKNIFTTKENCTAFFIVKPNGKYMKFYGYDYFTEVKAFLNKR